jgi:hypothetical protein
MITVFLMSLVIVALSTVSLLTCYKLKRVRDEQRNGIVSDEMFEKICNVSTVHLELEIMLFRTTFTVFLAIAIYSLYRLVSK